MVDLVVAKKICVTIAESNPSRLQGNLKNALKSSDYAEIRFDFLKPSLIPITLESVKKYLPRCVCTLRPRSEGGKFPKNETERISILKLISEYNPFLLDVEFNTVNKNKKLLQYLKRTKVPLLISWHDFRTTPNETILKRKLGEMSKISKNIKIVTTATKIEDSVKILSLYNNLPRKFNLVAFSMGDLGRMTRILCTQFGSPFTYVSLGKPVAPGQFSLKEVKAIFKLQLNKK